MRRFFVLISIISNSNLSFSCEFERGKTIDSVPNLIELAKVLTMILWSFGYISIYCEFGEMLTQQYELFNDELSQCNWYLFSIEIQQLLLITMANSQQPTKIRGFGNAICSRDSLKRVINPLDLKSISEISKRRFFQNSQTINTGFSYFLTYHRFNWSIHIRGVDQNFDKKLFQDVKNGCKLISFFNHCFIFCENFIKTKRFKEIKIAQMANFFEDSEPQAYTYYVLAQL